jgi:hypothetical protein
MRPGAGRAFNLVAYPKYPLAEPRLVSTQCPRVSDHKHVTNKASGRGPSGRLARHQFAGEPSWLPGSICPRGYVVTVSTRLFRTGHFLSAKGLGLPSPTAAPSRRQDRGLDARPRSGPDKGSASASRLRQRLAMASHPAFAIPSFDINPRLSASRACARSVAIWSPFMMLRLRPRRRTRSPS